MRTTKGSPTLYKKEKQIVTIPRTPLKPVFIRFHAHTLDTTQPHRISIHATFAARIFCALMFILGVLLLLVVFITHLQASFIAGGILLLLIGMIAILTMMQQTILKKENSRLLFIRRKSLRTPVSHSYALTELACIQLLCVTIESGTLGYQDADVPVTFYEVNLVLQGPSPERLWLYSNRNLSVAQNAAERIASFLGITVLDHSKEL